MFVARYLKERNSEAKHQEYTFQWNSEKVTLKNLCKKSAVTGADGKVRARGKAWPTGEAEPAAWMIDKVDPMGNHQGAPGVFAFAQFGAYLDNIKIVANQ